MLRKPILFAREMFDPHLSFYAASLSFYTIFTIIPLLLLLLTLSTTLSDFASYYEMARLFIFSQLLPSNSEMVMNYINGFLQNAVEMSAFSFIALGVSSLLFFQNFEEIASVIFKSKQRGFFRSIAVFFTLMLVAPLLLGISLAITGYIVEISSNHGALANSMALIATPYAITWVLFFLIFNIAVTTKIALKASLFSSFLTAVVFNLAKSGFIYYAFFNNSYALIYGSFSIIMFLFLWIYISWLIFVYGLKLCHKLNRL